MTTRTLRWILPALTTATLLLAAAPVPAAETTDSYELPLKGAPSDRGVARNSVPPTAQSRTSIVSARNVPGAILPSAGGALLNNAYWFDTPFETFMYTVFSSPYRFDTPVRSYLYADNGDGTRTVSETAFSYDTRPGIVLATGDDGAVLVDLPFAFSFAGASYSQMYVSGNGAVSFGDILNPGGFYSSNDFFSVTPKIAAYYVDLDETAGGDVYVLSEADRCTVTWNNVFEYGTTNLNTVQLVLYPDGNFTITYAQVISTVAVTGSHIITGYHPGGSPGLEEISLSDGLPYLSGPGAAVFEQYYGSVGNSTVVSFPFGFNELGTVIATGDDGAVLVDLPFSFLFGNTSYSQMYVSGNGAVSFGDVLNPSGFYSVNDFFSPTPKIAAYYMDLDETAGGDVYVLSEADRYTVTWNNVFEAGTGAPNTFQLVLYLNGTFTITYGQITSVYASNGAHIITGYHPGGNPGLNEISLSDGLPYSSPVNAAVFERYYDLPDLPNLTVVDLQFSSQRIANGEPECRTWMSNVEVWATVVNTGDANTNIQGWASRIILCTDPSLQGCFMNVGAPVQGGLLAPGDTLTLYLTDDFYWVGSGQYYLGVEVDYGKIVSESDEMDNKAAIPIQILEDLPDLSIDNLFAPPSVAIGDNVGGLFGGTMYNLGCGYAIGTNRVAFVISPDPIIDVNDVHVASYYPASPAPGNTRNITCPQALIPSNTPQGSVYFGMIVDRSFQITESNEQNNFSVAVPITVLPASASADTSWVYFNDFQSGPDGWESMDFTGTENHWNRADYDDAGTTRGVMWCGTNEGLQTPPGYGNSWVTDLTKSFPNGAMSIEYSIQYDTEPSYDFVHVQVSNDNFATYLNIRSFGDYSSYRSSGFETYTDFIPIPGPVSIRFRFTSDAAWSDEDGILDTDGACRLDYVNVQTGTSLNDPIDVATFDSGSDGWVGSGAPGTSGTPYRLVQDPACGGGLPCDSLYVRLSDDGQTPVRRPINICSAWVGYDGQGNFPPRPNPDIAVRTGIESPPIPLPPDGEKYVLRYDVFSNLPLAADPNLFHAYYVSFDDGGWLSGGTVFFGLQGWRRIIRDITTLRPPGATSVRIRIGVTEYYSEEGDHTGYGGPIFDNVAVGVVNSPSQAGGGVTYLPGTCDFDHDGVLDSADACPEHNAAPFDKDADGCTDAVASSRNIEYWLPPTFPVHYSISSQAPAGLSLSEVESEIQTAFNTWTGVSGSDASFQYDGTTPATDAVAGDGVNIVTFNDPDYPFPNGVLAVGVATSYTRRTRVDGVYYRPGQIRDADMIFSPRESFRTPGGGSPTGVDMRSVATHEAGHVLGLSHSSVRSSTMFYVLPQGTNASTLEAEDVSTLRSAYPNALLMANKAELRGFVRDGYTSAGIPGVIVFAISEATGDTTGCTYTLGDGSYQFVGIDPMSVYVAIHALDGSSDIGYITQDNINELIADMDIEPIVAEYYDADESSGDDPNARTAVALIPGGTTTVDIVTNIDSEGPTVISVAPADNALDVPIDAAIRVTFSEAIDIATVGGNLRLRNLTTSALVGGNAAFFDDGRTLSFIPSDYFAFQAPYQLELGPDLADRFGNTLGSPVHSGFVTQARPPVSISSLAPSRGVAGSVLVISGFGFDAVATNNSVTLGATLLTPSTASPTELVVTVPSDTPEGTISLSATNLVTSDVSNAVTFTVLPREDVARGFTTEERVLSSTPRAIRVSGAGGWAFVGTDAGISAVNVDRASASYLQQTNIPIVDGVQSLDVTPDGRNLFAVSRVSRKIYRVNADPGAGPFGVLAEHTLDEEPLGITIDPAGQTAYIVLGNGLIVIWDVRPGQPTFDQAIGSIDTGDLNLRGKFAIHPSGNRLLLLSGIGKLRVLDLASRTVTGSVSVGTSPEDVVIDPKGSHAYVTDSDGFVTVIALETLKPVVNLATGGSLRGLAVSPSGSFLFAVDHELNFLDVIDLRATSSSFGTVAERAPTPVDPIDVELSTDGLYAYAIVESGNRIVVTSIGVGPVVRTMSRYAGPVGSKVVFSGSGFTEAAQTVVTFNGASVSPERLAEDVVVVSVPAGASSGPALVEGLNPGSQTLKSNSFYFEVLGPTSNDAFVAGEMASDALSADRVDLAISPSGGPAVILAQEAGNFQVHLADTDPVSDSFHAFIGSVGGTDAVDVAVSPDGSRACLLLGNASVRMVDINPLSEAYLSDVALIDLSGQNATPERLAVSPGGDLLLVSGTGGGGGGNVFVVDIDPESATAYQLLSAASVEDGGLGLTGRAVEMAFHPAGAFAYVPVLDADSPFVRVLDVNRDSATFGTFIFDLALALPAGHTPKALSFTPDGARCLVLASPHGLPGDRTILMLNTSSPGAPQNSVSQPIASSEMDAPEGISVSPRGDRCVVSLRGSGFHHFSIQNNPDALAPLGTFGDPGDHTESAAGAYAADASRYYAASASSDLIRVYVTTDAQSIAMKSGDGQTGVVNKPLASPLEVQVGGGGLSSVLVRFSVASGDGTLNGGLSAAVVPTDDSGVARVTWTLGATPGLQSVEASASGLLGSPVAFNATALEDPDALPLSLVDVLPAADKTGVSTTTTVLAIFSRPVDPATVNSLSFSLRQGSEIVPGLIGFADGNRRISITPSSALDVQQTYFIDIGGGLRDTSGGELVNPVVSQFTTQAPPPLDLTAASPQSGTTSITVNLSGSGFAQDVASNAVQFDGAVGAVITKASPNALAITIPSTLAPGEHTLQVHVGAQSSAPLSFHVLQESATPFDTETGRVGTASETRAVAIAPNGRYVYAVAPKADAVYVLDLETEDFISAIPVGDNPYAIIMHPYGEVAYVANLLSATVSVIGIKPGSEDFNRVVGTIRVGLYPTDLAITGSGDKLFVANFGSDDLSIIDSNHTSESYHSVLGSVNTGTGTRSVAVTPDGGRVYVGTAEGYIVLSTVDFGVIGSAGTGTSTKSVAITPDGTLAIVLTTQGLVLVFDIAPGSKSENQVVVSGGTGTIAKSVTVSPDGGLGFLVTDQFIIVVSLSLGSGVSVISKPTPPTLPVVAVITAGENPSAVAFDPRGSGAFVVTNSGDNSISIFGGELPPPEADVVVGPETFIRKRKAKYVNARIEFAPGYSVEDVDVSTVYLHVGAYPDSIHADQVIYEFGDSDLDSIPDLSVKFDAALFSRHVGLETSVFANVTGEVVGKRFSGGSTVNIVDTSPGLQMALSGSFTGRSEPEGAVLRWSTSSEAELAGFNLYRASNPEGPYEPVNTALIEAAGESEAAKYLCHDATAILNRTYYYKLSVVGETSVEEAGPFRIIFRAPFALEQNAPNPFNPTTRIRFTLPEDGQASLIIYDVAGRRVRTLFDEKRLANRYTVIWDGRNDAGQPVASGVYFSRLVAGGNRQTRKMILLK